MTSTRNEMKNVTIQYHVNECVYLALYEWYNLSYYTILIWRMNFK